ncbi:MAG: helix-turn-helix domain-containing protein [Lentilactobacillus diolivorans]|jgi:transcriptional regulator with XRE-family HTH domain|uniref:Helix-turn-helix domain-containing protein n=1 Tax=Lentilactobacillus hilgardii TaxID=1588 RepID=A0A6P1E701_LENHI|nr:helix-turn-helix transcriptional regulator [Lentilactobacillus hilgardii]EEI72617.1 DNA-binding helix-turn-helix protein [Lentilactobacillus hilgardii ATCC 27305]MCH4164959.1 helix-turn-helix domain-containing protein [Lentilactobacillus diolivorans]QHB53176.1 helix-turn-helix domain-containing protein [Lentilactobacillus hilgardii]
MNSKLIENLKFFRKQNHLNQNQLAIKLNVSRPTISSWETGRTTPDIDTLVRIASFYQVPVDQLLFTRSHSKGNINKSQKHILGILLMILIIERFTVDAPPAARGWIDILALIPALLYLPLALVNRNWLISRISLPIYTAGLFLFGVLGIGSSVINLFSMGPGFQTSCFICGLIALGYLGKNKLTYLFWRIREITVS